MSEFTISSLHSYTVFSTVKFFLHLSLIVTLVLSCTVSEIRPLIGSKMRILPTLCHSAPPFSMFPFEFRGEVNHRKLDSWGCFCGESCMILTLTVFD